MPLLKPALRSFWVAATCVLASSTLLASSPNIGIRVCAVYQGRPVAHWVAAIKGDDADRLASVAALEAFASLDNAEAIQSLILALGDSDGSVREAAAGAMARLGPIVASAVVPLTKAMADVSPVVRTCAVQSLSRIGPQAVPALVAILTDARAVHESRLGAAEALLAMGDAAKGHVGRVATVLDDPSPSVRFAAARLLVALAPGGEHADKVVAVLHAAMDDPASRIPALQALRVMGPKAKPAIPSLIKLLKNCRPPDFRYFDYHFGSGSSHFDLISHRRPFPVLSPDPNAEAARLAADVLAAIGPDAVPPLLGVLSEKQKPLAHDAVCAILGRLGPGAAAALPLLTEIATNPADSPASFAAAAAVLLIDPQHKHPVKPEKLWALLDAPGAHPVRWACETLATQQGSAVADKLIAFLVLQGPAVAAEAQGALAMIGKPAAEKLLSTLLERGSVQFNVQNSQHLIQMLMGMGPTLSEAILGRLPGADAKAQASLLTYLGWTSQGSEAAAMALVGALDSKDFAVRSAALEGLRRFGAQSRIIVRALVKLASQETFTQHYELYELFRMLRGWPVEHAKAFLPLLVKTILDDSAGGKFPRVAAAEALGAMGPVASDALPALLHMLKAERDRDAREAAMDAMVAIAPGEANIAAVLMKSAEEDPEPLARCKAFFSLYRVHVKAEVMVPFVLTYLKTKHAQSYSLGPIGYQILEKYGPAAAPAVDELIQGLQSGRYDATVAAASALAAIGPEAARAVPALTKLVPGDAAADIAIRALGAIGPAASEAIPVLKQRLTSRGGYDAVAYAALAKISPIAAEPFALAHGRPTVDPARWLEGGKAVLPRMLAELATPAATPRPRLIAAVGKLGPEAAQATPLLRDIALELSNPLTDRLAAISALKSIAPDSISDPVLKSTTRPWMYPNVK